MVVFREERVVYYVQVVSVITSKILYDVYCGEDYEQAVKEKDKLDLELTDDFTYTKIESYDEECY